MFSPFRKVMLSTLRANTRYLSTTMALRKNHYDVLGVPRNASQAEIKNAYFKLTKLYHPDKIAATDENLRKFREISEAYEVLGNELSRQLYDKGLLGDYKRVGEDTTPSSDPIIAFYKKRQDMARILVTETETSPWTSSELSQMKKKKKLHDLFSMKTTRGIKQDYLIDWLFAPIVYYFVLVFLIFTNYEGSFPANVMNKCKAILNLK